MYVDARHCGYPTKAQPKVYRGETDLIVTSEERVDLLELVLEGLHDGAIEASRGGW